MCVWFLALITNLSIISPDIDSTTLVKARYDSAFQFLDEQLKVRGSFKSCVFFVEQAFSRGNLKETDFNNSIAFLKTLANDVKNTVKIQYFKDDSINCLTNLSIFSVMKDTLVILSDSSLSRRIPFLYNFEDPEGKKEWSDMFVTKLLATHKGNCHSLVYLYKILADELGAKCWIALAPHHMYIRNYNEAIGWYNTELTSGAFPTDAWIALTGYVSTDAIRSGVYMDTLSNQQSIALCALDLAKEYEMQTHNYYNGFILKCCGLVLRYHPVNPQALLLKAETLQKIYFRQKKEHKPDAGITYEAMEKTYVTLAKLGYREMPEKIYLQWLQSVVKEKDK